MIGIAVTRRSAYLYMDAWLTLAIWRLSAPHQALGRQASSADCRQLFPVVVAELARRGIASRPGTRPAAVFCGRGCGSMMR